MGLRNLLTGFETLSMAPNNVFCDIEYLVNGLQTSPAALVLMGVMICVRPTISRSLSVICRSWLTLSVCMHAPAIN